MVKIYILCIIVWSSVCVTFAERIPDFGTCQTASNDPGLCVHLPNCDYIKNMTLRNTKTSFESDYFRRSQCGEDDKQTDAQSKVLVCCSNKFLDGEKIPGNVLPSEGYCGTSSEEKVDFKIVGGSVAKLNEFPWLALLEYKFPNDSKILGSHGALISSRYVLTAAHCISPLTLNIFNLTLSRVRLGEFDMNTDPDCNQGECASAHVDIDVERSIAHESYIGDRHQHYDIGLIRLADYVPYNKYIRPICLPLAQNLRNNQFENTEMEVSGWGTTSQNLIFSHIKLKATIKGLPLDVCQRKYSPHNFTLNENQLCAGGEEGVESCKGDSGGPLMLKTNFSQTNLYYAAGIISYGRTPCGFKDWPSVFTKVGSYIDWIIDNLEP